MELLLQFFYFFFRKSANIYSNIRGISTSDNHLMLKIEDNLDQRESLSNPTTMILGLIN